MVFVGVQAAGEETDTSNDPEDVKRIRHIRVALLATFERGRQHANSLLEKAREVMVDRHTAQIRRPSDPQTA